MGWLSLFRPVGLGVLLVLSFYARQQAGSRRLRNVKGRKLAVLYTLDTTLHQYQYCDQEHWNQVASTVTMVASLYDCESRAADISASAFLVWPDGNEYACAMCTHGIPATLGDDAWQVQLYIAVDSTPAPTSTAATPTPTAADTATPTSVATPAPTMAAGWNLLDMQFCPSNWGQVWIAAIQVANEDECKDHLLEAITSQGLDSGAMVTTNVGGHLSCVLCQDTTGEHMPASQIGANEWFHMYIYTVEDSSDPTPIETPMPTALGNYPDHYMVFEAGGTCLQPLSQADCEALVPLYSHSPTLAEQPGFSTVNTKQLPAGCLFQPAGKILVFNANPQGGGHDELPSGELVLLCKEEDPQGRHVYIKNKHGLCLDAKERRDRAGVVHMWPCDQTGPADEMNKNQHWDYDRLTGQVKSHDGICLDASERGTNGGQVWMWPCEQHNKNQQWDYDKDTFQLINRYGFCLDARQRQTRGGLIHMWKCMPGNKNQQWLFTNTAHDYESKMDYSQNILQYGSWMGAEQN